MDNHDLAEIWAYHEGTKHSVETVYRSGHRLDWAIMPRPFKVYPDLEPIPLPQDFTSATRPALAALADRGTPSGEGPRLGRTALARLLYFSAGVLRRKTYAGGEIYFRAAACTGALYHIDLYLISGPLDDLEAGVYHFGPHDFAPRRLRAGDHPAAVVAATAAEPAVAGAPARAGGPPPHLAGARPRARPCRRQGGAPRGAPRSPPRRSRRPTAGPSRSRRALRRPSPSRR